VVERDHPAAVVQLSEQSGVDSVLGLGAALEAVAADEAGGIGAEELDFEVPEVEAAAAGRVSAIVALVMVERGLPVLLDLAPGDE
jgi:hypothetical protein